MVSPVGGPQITSFTGSESLPVANASSMETWSTVAQFTQFSNPYVYTNTQTASATLTAPQLAGNCPSTYLITPPQCYMYCGTSLGADATFTMPTVAQFIAQFSLQSFGSSFELDVVNAATSKNVIVAVGTGWTSTGTLTVSNNTWRKFLVTLTSATAGTITMVEVGTYS